MSSSERVTEKPVLVTGGTGWLASHVIYQLLDQGYKVRATVRDLKSSRCDFLRNQDFHEKAAENLTLVEADLEKEENWAANIEGCEYVIHVASPFKFKYKDHDKELVRPAVDGVRNVFKACFKEGSGVKRIIQTSSVCSVVYGHPQERFACNRMVMDMARKTFNDECSTQCEATGEKENNAPSGGDDLQEVPTRATDVPEELFDPYFEKRTNNLLPTMWGDWKLFGPEDWSVPEKIKGYELSKVLAEKEAWALIKEHNTTCPDRQIDLVTICPGFIFGPIFDSAHNNAESSIHVLRLLQRTYPIVPPINSSHVDVRDAAACHILAMTKPGAAGKRFMAVADDGNLDFAEQAVLLRNAVGKFGFNIPTAKSPKILTSLGALFSTSIAAAASKVNDLSYVSNEQTHKELGLTKWRTTEGALYAHAITLAKCGAVTGHKIPKEILNGFRAY